MTDKNIGCYQVLGKSPRLVPIKSAELLINKTVVISLLTRVLLERLMGSDSTTT